MKTINRKLAKLVLGLAFRYSWARWLFNRGGYRFRNWAFCTGFAVDGLVTTGMPFKKN